MFILFTYVTEDDLTMVESAMTNNLFVYVIVFTEYHIEINCY